jgi:hypothetical protein
MIAYVEEGAGGRQGRILLGRTQLNTLRARGLLEESAPQMNDMGAHLEK